MSAMDDIGATNAMVINAMGAVNAIGAMDTIFAMHAMVMDAVVIAIRELSSSHRIRGLVDYRKRLRRRCRRPLKRVRHIETVPWQLYLKKSSELFWRLLATLCSAEL